MNPNQDISIKTLQPRQSHTGEDYLKRRPWITLEIKNSGSINWYYDMEATRHGLNLIIKDESGAIVPLNEPGRSAAAFQDLHRGRRYGVFGLQYPATIELSIADYCILASGKTYTVSVEWTLNVHDIKPVRKVLEPEWTHKVTLKAPPVAVVVP